MYLVLFFDSVQLKKKLKSNSSDFLLAIKKFRKKLGHKNVKWTELDHILIELFQSS
jgi:hypothetical protein